MERNNRRKVGGNRPFRVLLWTLPVFLTGCARYTGGDVLRPEGAGGEELAGLIRLSLGLMLLVIAVVCTLFVRFLLRYRERPGHTRPLADAQTGNRRLEIAWTVLPLLILAVIAVPTVQATFNQEEKSAQRDALRVKVTAHQYWWEFHYPAQGVTTSGTLHLPAGRDVVLELRSKDVIHSFWVPRLGGKEDAIPGRVNRLHLKAEKPGEYRGKCAELCGVGHTYMSFGVKAEDSRSFRQWTANMKKEHAPRTPSAQAGEKVFRRDCLSCHAVDGAADPGKRGPNLAGLHERERIGGVLPNNPANLRKWILKPKDVKPDAKMPGFPHLGSREKAALADYLTTLDPGGHRDSEGD